MTEHYLLIKLDDLIMAVEHDLDAGQLTPHRHGRLHDTLGHLNRARAALLAGEREY